MPGFDTERSLHQQLLVTAQRRVVSVRRALARFNYHLIETIIFRFFFSWLAEKYFFLLLYNQRAVTAIRRLLWGKFILSHCRLVDSDVTCKERKTTIKTTTWGNSLPLLLLVLYERIVDVGTE